MAKVKITILIDDLNGAKEGYRISYGFSALIETNKKKILFDTGTNVPPLLYNLKKYGIKPSSIDSVILSHNHFDHTDGLPGIIKENKDVPVYVHKHWNIPVTYQGLPIPERNIVINQNARECNEISNGIYLTNSYLSSDYGGIHEQACYIQSDTSYILICGCCHPGLNNFLKDREILKIPLNEPLHIMGGMHSFRFAPQKATELNPKINSIILFHCTENIKTFQEQFKRKCQIGIVGQTMVF